MRLGVFGGFSAKTQGQDLEHYFEVVNSNGSPVDLFYRIDSGRNKLYEGQLGNHGSTKAVTLETAVNVRFWSKSV